MNDLDTIEKAYELGASEVVLAIKDASFTAATKHDISCLTQYPNSSVLLNRFYFPMETSFLLEQLNWLKDSQVNHIYFSDPAVIYYAKQMNLVEKLIYRPDTLTVSVPDISFWMAQGIASTVISPLITLEETESILKHCKDTEIMIHGHLLLSASRRKLVSSYQSHYDVSFEPTHQPLYLQESKRDGLMPIYEDEFGTLIYSDYVFSSFAEMKSLEAKRYLIDGTLLEETEILDAIKAYQAIANDSDANEIEKTYRELHPNTILKSGYYREKTIK